MRRDSGGFPEVATHLPLEMNPCTAGRILHEGSVWDASDEFVMKNPEMFGRPNEAA